MAALSTYLLLARLGQAEINKNISNDRSDREQDYQRQEIAKQKESELTKRKGLIDSQRRQLLGKGDAPQYKLGVTGATGVSQTMGVADTLTGVTLG